MVSINRESNISGRGGIFFNEGSLSSSTSDTNQLLHPVIGPEKVKNCIPLNTIPAAILILFLSIILEVVVIAFALYWTNSQKCEPYFFMIYGHVVYWGIIFMLDCYFKRKHHESRIRGYLEIYQKTHQHSRIPFYVTSIFNSALLVIEALCHEQYGDFKSKCVLNGLLTPINYMCFFITLENAFIIPVVTSYVYRVHQLNKSQLRPDVQRDEWMASFVQESYSVGEVGYREMDNHIEDLLEKQADLLRYFKEQNTRLVQKVLILSTQLNERELPQFT